mmetsp:Transcript_10492/g.21114  ORF Transcript_10492/g.21114 Transcript_10492/m.21114 type:complete len:114 (-) Transcript_10492:1071-1412(-)
MGLCPSARIDKSMEVVPALRHMVRTVMSRLAREASASAVVTLRVDAVASMFDEVAEAMIPSLYTVVCTILGFTACAMGGRIKYTSDPTLVTRKVVVFSAGATRQSPERTDDDA